MSGDRLSGLRILAISNCAPHDYYLIQQVSARWPLCGLWRPVWRQASRRSGVVRVLNRRLPGSLRRRLAQGYFNEAFRRRDRAVAQRLFGTRGVPVAAHAVEMEVDRITGEAVRQRLAELNPDVILVSGGPILRPEIYGAAGIAALNVHYGIAPDYRGEHSLFWSLYHRDYEKIGITLHHLSRGVDSGRILARGYPALAAGDDEAALWAKFAHLAAQMTVDLLTRLAERPGWLPEGRDQEHMRGRLYRAHDRTFARDAFFRMRQALFPSALPPRAERIESYY